MKINFFSEQTSFTPKGKLKIRNWVISTAKQHGFNIVEINYIFCNDNYLHKINVDFLNHDNLTDIITFDNSDKKQKTKNIQSDIFISIERVKENAIAYSKNFEQELLRVLIHGVLHLCGFKDKLTAEKAIMRIEEQKAIDHYFNCYE